MQTWTEALKKEQELNAKDDQIKFEMKLQETRMRSHAEDAVKDESILSKVSPNSSCSSMMAKLPKLVISKFDGSYQDWPRFWGQFTETIDKASIHPITKFTSLCELLDPKIKHVIDSFKFTLEGYNRAKAILASRYGKESEIVKSFVKEIMELPHIPNANP